MPLGPHRAYYTITRLPRCVILTRRASFDGILVTVHRRWFFGRDAVDRAIHYLYGRS